MSIYLCNRQFLSSKGYPLITLIKLSISFEGALHACFNAFMLGGHSHMMSWGGMGFVDKSQIFWIHCEIRTGDQNVKFLRMLYMIATRRRFWNLRVGVCGSTPHGANIIQQSHCHPLPSLLFHTHKCPSHPWSIHPDAEEINNSEMQWPGSARAQRDGLPPVRISVTFSALLPFLENFL